MNLSDAEDFDFYCKTMGILPHEEGPAFATWLNSIAGDIDFDSPPFADVC